MTGVSQSAEFKLPVLPLVGHALTGRTIRFAAPYPAPAGILGEEARADMAEVVYRAGLDAEGRPGVQEHGEQGRFTDHIAPTRPGVQDRF